MPTRNQLRSSQRQTNGKLSLWFILGHLLKHLIRVRL